MLAHEAAAPLEIGIPLVGEDSDQPTVVDAAYFDTRAVTGGYTEIHNDPPRIIAAFASWRHAHELHQPGDPAIIADPT